MSYGNESGRTRSGGKSFSNKKAKRKKQEFHTHRRVQFQESERPDPEQLRARTTLALERLGHQVLSTEPGGYDLEDWMRNLNSLLDDFQEKVGDVLITEAFRERRRAALLPLTQPPAGGDVDSEMEKALQEEAAAKAALADLARVAAAKLAALKEERDSIAGKLGAAKESLARLKEAKQTRGFFARLTGGSPSTERAEAEVAEFESRLKAIDGEIDAQRKARSATGEGDAANREARAKLETVETRLAELQSAKLSLLQLSEEREAATKAIAELISTMNLGTSPRGGSA